MQAGALVPMAAINLGLPIGVSAGMPGCDVDAPGLDLVCEPVPMGDDVEFFCPLGGGLGPGLAQLEQQCGGSRSSIETWLDVPHLKPT